MSLPLSSLAKFHPVLPARHCRYFGKFPPQQSLLLFPNNCWIIGKFGAYTMARPQVQACSLLHSVFFVATNLGRLPMYFLPTWAAYYTDAAGGLFFQIVRQILIKSMSTLATTGSFQLLGSLTGTIDYKVPLLASINKHPLTDPCFILSYSLFSACVSLQH